MSSPPLWAKWRTAYLTFPVNELKSHTSCKRHRIKFVKLWCRHTWNCPRKNNLYWEVLINLRHRKLTAGIRPISSGKSSDMLKSNKKNRKQLQSLNRKYRENSPSKKLYKSHKTHWKWKLRSKSEKIRMKTRAHWLILSVVLASHMRKWKTRWTNIRRRNTSIKNLRTWILAPTWSAKIGIKSIRSIFR